MSDYFEEMGWQPVEAERTNEHQMLLVARFFMENGIFFDEFDTESLAPPAALEVVRNLPEKPCSGVGERCAICLKPNVTTAEDAAIDDDGGDDDQQDGKSQTPADKVQIEEGGGAPTNNFKVLPCEHAFHAQCILPWLEKVRLYLGFSAK